MRKFLTKNYANDPMVVVERPAEGKAHTLTFHRDRDLHVALWKAENNVESRNSRGELI